MPQGEPTHAEMIATVKRLVDPAPMPYSDQDANADLAVLRAVLRLLESLKPDAQQEG